MVSDNCCSILSTTFLNEGLLKWSASQQDLIMWYLQGSTVFVFSVHIAFWSQLHRVNNIHMKPEQTHSCFPPDSHFTGCKLWSIKSVSFFYQFVELSVHRHTRVGTVSCNQSREVTVSAAETTQNEAQTHTVWMVYSTYLGRRFPIVKYHRTTHHSQMYTHSQRCFLETSTSRADEPEKKHMESQMNEMSSVLFPPKFGSNYRTHL